MDFKQSCERFGKWAITQDTEDAGCISGAFNFFFLFLLPLAILSGTVGIDNWGGAILLITFMALTVKALESGHARLLYSVYFSICLITFFLWICVWTFPVALLSFLAFCGWLASKNQAHITVKAASEILLPASLGLSVLAALFFILRLGIFFDIEAIIEIRNGLIILRSKLWNFSLLSFPSSLLLLTILALLAGLVPRLRPVSRFLRLKRAMKFLYLVAIAATSFTVTVKAPLDWNANQMYALLQSKLQNGAQKEAEYRLDIVMADYVSAELETLDSVAVESLKELMENIDSLSYGDVFENPLDFILMGFQEATSYLKDFKIRVVERVGDRCAVAALQLKQRNLPKGQWDVPVIIQEGEGKDPPYKHQLSAPHESEAWASLNEQVESRQKSVARAQAIAHERVTAVKAIFLESLGLILPSHITIAEAYFNRIITKSVDVLLDHTLPRSNKSIDNTRLGDQFVTESKRLLSKIRLLDFVSTFKADKLGGNRNEIIREVVRSETLAEAKSVRAREFAKISRRTARSRSGSRAIRGR